MGLLQQVGGFGYFGRVEAVKMTCDDSIITAPAFSFGGVVR